MTVIDCVAGTLCFSYFKCSATCATTMKRPTNSAETVRRSSKASSKSGGEKPRAMTTLSESLANPYPPCATCGAVFGKTHHSALTYQLVMWGDYHWATEAVGTLDLDPLSPKGDMCDVCNRACSLQNPTGKYATTSRVIMKTSTSRALFLKAREKLVARIRRAGRSESPSPRKPSRNLRSSRPASPEA